MGRGIKQQVLKFLKVYFYIFEHFLGVFYYLFYQFFCSFILHFYTRQLKNVWLETLSQCTFLLSEYTVFYQCTVFFWSRIFWKKIVDNSLVDCTKIRPKIFMEKIIIFWSDEWVEEKCWERKREGRKDFLWWDQIEQAFLRVFGRNCLIFELK